MAQRIHIFGASGSGTTTLGRELAGHLDGVHLDTDSYYWFETNPPFTDKREPSERIRLIERDAGEAESWVLSGSICSWGDPLLDHFTLAVFLQLDAKERMLRLAERERARYGERISVGGDMRELHEAFMAWARSYDEEKAPVRSLDMHEKWMEQLTCPVLRLDSACAVEQLCEQVVRLLATDSA